MSGLQPASLFPSSSVNYKLLISWVVQVVVPLPAVNQGGVRAMVDAVPADVTV